MPEKFDGKGSIDVFLMKFKECAEYNGWNHSEKLTQLRMCLTGSAAQMLASTASSCITVSQLEDQHKRRYGVEGQGPIYRSQLRSRRRAKGESIQELNAMISNETVAVDAFLSSLNDESLEQRVRDHQPCSLESAYQKALLFEAISRSRCGTVNKSKKLCEEPYHFRFEGKPKAARKLQAAAQRAGNQPAAAIDVKAENSVRQELRNSLATMNECMAKMEQSASSKTANTH